MSSPIVSVVTRLVRFPGALTDGIRQLTVEEAAGLASLWSGGWARAAQEPPQGAWRSAGWLGGRGSGKTRSACETVLREVREGRGTRVALMAQSLDETIGVMVQGESGLIECSPPWDRPEWHSDRLVWPNGSVGYVYTPERPAGLRGHQHDLAWVSEVASWSAARRSEAWSNIRLTLRLGLGRLVWDGTPRRRNPLVRELLERCARDPERHILRTATTLDNRQNLAPESVDEWLREFGGTQKGEEELMGKFLDDDLDGLVRQAWIDDARRDLPPTLVRRVIAVDPAISMREGTDATGIVEVGRGIDDQLYVVSDHTARMNWEAWTGLVCDLYIRGRCDCMVLERNRGGDALVAGVRAAARERGHEVFVVEAGATTRQASGTIYIKEVIGRGSKESRLEPVAGLYERGRVSHVRSAQLAELEEQLTTWIPGEGQSPNALDAAVHGLWEVSQLGSTRRSPEQTSRDIAGALKMTQELACPTSRTSIFADAYRPSGSLPVVYGGMGRKI